MQLRLRRPSTQHLSDLVERQRGASVTYSPVGLTELGDVPDGFRRDVWHRELGCGADTFASAVKTLEAWGAHTGAGLSIVADGPPTVGAVVGIAAPLPVGFVALACRVVAVVETADTWSCTYGTLPGHPECGEERFRVTMSPDGTVGFEIVVVWRPGHLLTRLAPPVTRRLQRQATERYLDAVDTAARPAPSTSPMPAAS